MSDSILVTGATGFHGLAIISAIRRHGATPLSVLARNPSKAVVSPDLRVTAGSLSDREAVRRSLEGARAVIHSASYIGYEPRLCAEVNVGGTALLVEEAVKAGIRSFVYMSTSAVYGPGPHRGVTPGQAPDAVPSVLSQSRRDAEEIVLAAGGSVIRPALVFGCGDRWMVPSVVRIAETLGAVPEWGAARLSVINVRVLGEIVAEAVLVGSQSFPPILNAANPDPATVADLLGALGKHGILPSTSLPSMPLAAAETKAVSLGLPVSQARSLGSDNWIDTEPLWAVSGLERPRAFELSSEDVHYYRVMLGSTP